MDLNQVKENYSKAYIRSIAAVAGCVVEMPENDRDSIDLKIRGYPSSQGKLKTVTIDVQLKCTWNYTQHDDSIGFRLKIKDYNDLRRQSHFPFILVVVLVPKNKNEWIEQSEENLLMRYCGYWASLENMPAESSDKIIIRIPRVNVFTPNAIQEIIDNFCNKGEL